MKKKKVKQKAKRSLFHKIVNVFIAAFASIIVLFVLFIGVSQTSTFRNYLKEKIVETVNSSISGRLFIGEINGTLLTTLSIKEIALSDSSNQTIFYSDEIDIKVNPFALLTRKIHLREIAVNNAQLSILQNESGQWNLSTLSPPDTSKPTIEKPKPEESSSFPFLIQANNLQLNNFRFVMQTRENVGNQKVYRYINFNDLIIDKFNLTANAIADISKNNYSLNLKRLSFDPNVERFNLQKFSGIFVYQNKNAIVKDFKLISDDSNIQINATLNNADFFNNFSLERLQKTPADVEVVLDPFVFDDLSSFIPVTNLLGNKVQLHLKANGPYGDLNIEKLNLEMKSTKLNVTGNVKNLHKPSDLFLDVNIKDSYANYNDVKSLLPKMGLPDFGDIELINFNAEFKGRPTNFTADINTNVNEGEISGKTILNLDAKPIEYNIDLTTKNLDLYPILNSNSKLQSQIKLVGEGSSPSELNSNINLKVNNSTFSGKRISELKFEGEAKKQKIDLSMLGNIENSEISLAGLVDFSNKVPSYDLKGEIDSLNLADFLSDKNFNSKLNFKFDANGSSFNIDSLIGVFNVKLDSSKFRDKKIDNSELTLQLVKGEENRNIYLSSDFVDFAITGKFSLKDAIDVVSYEASTIVDITSQKAKEFNPLYKADSSKTSPPVPQEIISKDLNFNYSFTFKDFELIATLLNEEKLDIAGSGSGKISNSKDNFTIETDMDIDYFLTAGDQVLYLSNLTTDFRLTRNNSSTTFDDLFGSISVNAERVYAGSDIENIEADIIFNQSRMFFNISSLIDKKIGLETDGSFVMSPREQTIELEDLDVVYNKVEWKNQRPIVMSLKPGQSLDIEDFSLYNDQAALFVYGIIYNDGRQNLQVDAKDIDGKLISKTFFNEENKLFNANLNINGSLSGTFTQPLLDFDVDLDSVSYSDIYFGELSGKFNYEDKNISIDAAFVDSTESVKPKLTINGNIPIDLNYQLKGDRFGDDELNLKIKSDNFNLAAVGNIIPGVKNQKGLLTTELNISGQVNNPGLYGDIKLQNGKFNLLANNLDYAADIVIKFDDKEFSIEKAIIKNAGGTAYDGVMNATGSGKLKSFVPDNATIRLNGDLAILSDRSRSAQPLIYGDLFISSNGEWVFNYRPSGSYFFGNVNIKNADLTFVAAAANYQGGTRYDYTIMKDTTNVDQIRLELEEIVASDKQETDTKSNSKLNLDYELNITTTNIAELEIILSQTLNQKLNLEVAGNLNYENIDGRSRAQGSFELLDGSKLEFFKTFEADGNIRFESDITDPYLNIVATYTSDYTPPNSTETKEVAVKLRLEGPVSQIGTNLANKPQNISVYVGARNIENNVPDERYDASDALSFILVNQFKGDLTAENRQQVANQTIGATAATSLLGSLLTGFVNQAVGDVVNNIQLSQAGEYTKFAVSGRFSNFKYSFGGTTEVFQNINKANLRVDYFFNPSFLIRLERKDPVVQTYGIEDKITELGLKYRFEF